ncbi:hypothetical protein GCM10011419_16820 [Vogesella fluminis]|uniref:Uncharacterized protein n=1 Tax=Vogesella fluminis TaxID=1069161 RepID=A0ABQ3HCP8_9NEIS|nr:hypothetical protein GCM10011419_16820 [Vogesella fluminis]
MLMRRNSHAAPTITASTSPSASITCTSPHKGDVPASAAGTAALTDSGNNGNTVRNRFISAAGGYARQA